MQSDRELLELAAKAVGMDLGKYADGWHWVNDGPRGAGIYKIDPNQSPVGNPRFRFLYWNPLTDDGDALRLAVKLDMQIWRNSGGTVSGMPPTGDFWKRLREPLEPDHYAATRRAIARAAAQLAQAHPDHKDGGSVYE